MLAVLITVFNRIEKTKRCLDQLAEALSSIEEDVDMYLVDDGSTDGTAQVLKEEYPMVQVIQGDGTLFWNRGMRLAWETAAQTNDYDFFLWLNNDTYIFPNFLNQLLQHSARNGNRSIICAQTCSEIDRAPTYGARNRKGSITSYQDGIAQCEIINGNLVLVPKFVFAKVGFLDGMFHHSLGDFDYSLRAAKLGIISYVTEEPLAYCESNPSPWIWCRSDVPLIERIRNLYSPAGGNPPHIHFLYEKRHFGLITASFHYFTIHIRVIFPKLWPKH